MTDAVWSASGKLAVVANGRVMIGMPGKLRSVGNGSEPDWAAGGDRLVVVRKGWVTVVRAANGKAKELARGAEPVFSPDGRWVAFVGAQNRVETIPSGGGKAKPVGTIRGKSVAWQSLPSGPPACVAPAGATVLASSPQTVVTSEQAPGAEGAPKTAVMGCLLSSGVERLLEASTSNSDDGETTYPAAAVGGTYAAVVADTQDPHYHTVGGEAMKVFDLRTGKPGGDGGESVSTLCPTSANSCGAIGSVVVGADGVSAVTELPTTAAGVSLQLLCASASLCMATDNLGQVLATTTPTQPAWGASTGAKMSANGAGGGSCPSVSLCVMVAYNVIYTSTDPAAGQWTATDVSATPFAQFAGVSCPSVSLCVATTVYGQVAVSTDPTGGASTWSVSDVDGMKSLNGISCPSSSECIATDNNGDVFTTTDPTGGAGSWTQQVSDGSSDPYLYSYGQLSCPSVSLCVVPQPQDGSSGINGLTGRIAVSTDPTSSQWPSTSLPGVRAVSCPSTSLCVAAAGNSIAYSTDPASGSWTSYTVSPAAGELSSIACPTATLCIAAGGDVNGSNGGGGDGEVLVSTDAAGGPSTWTPMLADQISCTALPTVCGTGEVIASDGSGVHVVGSDTEFGLQTQLTDLTLQGDTLTWEHSGSPMSAQLTP